MSELCIRCLSAGSVDGQEMCVFCIDDLADEQILAEQDASRDMPKTRMTLEALLGKSKVPSSSGGPVGQTARAADTGTTGEER